MKDRVVEVIKMVYGVSLEDLRSPNRKRELVRPRHMACYLFRTTTDLGVCEIGEILNRDHSTISTGHKKKMNDIGLYPKDRMELDRCLTLLDVRKETLYQAPPIGTHMVWQCAV